MRWIVWIAAAACGTVGAMLLFPASPTSPMHRLDGAGAAAPVAPARTADLSGSARVVDGDTLDLGGTRVRLHGVDAPEGGQICFTDGRGWPCGRHATRALAGLLDGRVVACVERDLDRYGRVVAVCQRDGLDINGWLVTEGWAVAYRRYSRQYVEQESQARGARRGIWGGEFAMPWDWRRGKRVVRPEAVAAPVTGAVARERGRCDIKGNVSYSSGRRIYHMPGDRDYAATRISAERGERWFCSEGEARVAGWQRAGQ